MPRIELAVRRVGGRWWITGEESPVGPYDTKEDALADVRGLHRFHKHGEVPGFATVAETPPEEVEDGSPD